MKFSGIILLFLLTSLAIPVFAHNDLFVNAQASVVSASEHSTKKVRRVKQKKIVKSTTRTKSIVTQSGILNILHTEVIQDGKMVTKPLYIFTDNKTKKSTEITLLRNEQLSNLLTGKYSVDVLYGSTDLNQKSNNISGVVLNNIQKTDIKKTIKNSTNCGPEINQSANINDCTLVVLYNVSGTSLPVDIESKEQIYQRIFNGDLKNFYHEQSYGKVVMGGNVTDWLNISSSTSLKDSPSQSLNVATPELEGYLAVNNLDITKYTRVMFLLYGSLVSGAAYTEPSSFQLNGTSTPLLTGYVGLGSGTTSIFPPSSTGTDLAGYYPYFTEQIFAHEMGHTFSVAHDNSVNCNGDINNHASCQSLEYGNPFSVMGGTSSYTHHFSSPFKYSIGWLDNNSMYWASGKNEYYVNNLEGTTPKSVFIDFLFNDGIPEYVIEKRGLIGYDTTALTDFEGVLVYRLYPTYGFPYWSDCCTLSSRAYLTEAHKMISGVSTNSAADFVLKPGESFIDNILGVRFTLQKDKAGYKVYPLKTKPTCITTPPQIGQIQHIFTNTPGVVSLSSAMENGVPVELIAEVLSSDSPSCYQKTNFKMGYEIDGSGTVQWQPDTYTDPVVPYSHVYNSKLVALPANISLGQHIITVHIKNSTTNMVSKKDFYITVVS